MTSNDTTNQSTLTLHIDEAIETARTIHNYHLNHTQDREEAAKVLGSINSLTAVRNGHIITDDLLFANRVTRALIAVLREDEDMWTNEERETIAEARLWVDGNPGVAS